MNLEQWGWNPSIKDAFEQFETSGLFPARVTKEQRHIYSLISESGPLKAEVSGGFQYRAMSPADFPAVGDWVACREASKGQAVIEALLPRKSSFSRKSAGERTDEQVLAANIDTVFLVFGLNGGRNLTAGAIERYLTLAWESGAEPVIILNKADLCSEEERYSAVLTVANSAPGVDIFPVSAITGEGLDELSARQLPGKTIALTGPSGVGKSTIINFLAGEGLQKTNPQREGDLRGKHTTTHKEMFRLPSGMILVDTPGLKEVQLWADEGSLDEAFRDIADLAEGCRFRDCSHQGEPGCAVQSALATGELEHRRYENYLDLERELKYLKTRQDAQAARQEREKWKDIAKLQKDLKKSFKRR